jgi:hypothetical protein
MDARRVGVEYHSLEGGHLKLTTDVMRGVVAVHGGYWRSGSKAKTAVNVLAGAEISNIGRAPAFSDVAVEVART